MAVRDDRSPRLVVALTRIDYSKILKIVVGAAQTRTDKRQLECKTCLLTQLTNLADLICALECGDFPLERYSEGIWELAVIFTGEGSQWLSFYEECILFEIIDDG